MVSKVKSILTLGMNLLENHYINESIPVIWKLLPQSTSFFLKFYLLSFMISHITRSKFLWGCSASLCRGYITCWSYFNQLVSSCHERHGSSSWLSVPYCISIDNVPNELLNTFPIQNHISMFIITSLANQLTQRQVSCYLVDNRKNVRSQIYTLENFQRFFK